MTDREIKMLCELVTKIVDKHKMSQYVRPALQRELTDSLTNLLTDPVSLKTKDELINVGDIVKIVDCESESYERFIGLPGTVVDKYVMIRVVMPDGSSCVMRPKYVDKIKEE